MPFKREAQKEAERLSARLAQIRQEEADLEEQLAALNKHWVRQGEATRPKPRASVLLRRELPGILSHGPKRARDIADDLEALGHDVPRVSDRLWKMADAGDLIERVSRGVYGLAAHDED